MGKLGASFFSAVSRQLDAVIPDFEDGAPILREHFDEALELTTGNVSSLREWRGKGFDPNVTFQYAAFLYTLSRVIFLDYGLNSTAIRIFSLNKCLNGVEAFPEIDLTDRFLLGHTVGLVFSKANYGQYCVFHQGCTVGRSKEDRPQLGEGVIMFPNSSVLGRCRIGNNAVISAGVQVINQDVPESCIAFQGFKGRLEFKKTQEHFSERYFFR